MLYDSSRIKLYALLAARPQIERLHTDIKLTLSIYRHANFLRLRRAYVGQFRSGLQSCVLCVNFAAIMGAYCKFVIISQPPGEQSYPASLRTQQPTCFHPVTAAARYNDPPSLWLLTLQCRPSLRRCLRVGRNFRLKSGERVGASLEILIGGLKGEELR